MSFTRFLPLLACVGFLSLSSFAEPVSPAAPNEPVRQEPYRPQYHFTPAQNWMNDPNGLVYFDGEYHLFFQYNPFGNKWGHMSWGHAVSRDLAHWEELPVAIPEKGEVMAFSGSTVVDWKNTSGLGRGDTPPLVALYTGYREKQDGAQAQYLAHSNDRGRTWQTFGDGPVLDLKVKDFRDPSVFWYSQGGYWILAAVLAADHQVVFFRSPNLKDWTELSRFGKVGSTAGVWECPNLIPLPVEGSPGQLKWVLLVSIGDGSPQGGSATQYFVGDFDGTSFRPDSVEGKVPTRWIDFGRDFYAAIPFNDIPDKDGRRLLLGWMNNWKYGQEIPTSPWRSAQSLVRSLSLTPDAQGPGLQLRQLPAAEYLTLRGEMHAVALKPLGSSALALGKSGQDHSVCELSIDIDPANASELRLVLGGSATALTLRYEVASSTLTLERPAGQFAVEGFAGSHSAKVPLVGGRLLLEVFVDRSLVEVFAAKGLVTISDQIFPAPGPLAWTLSAAGGEARLIESRVWQLRSIWK